VKRWHGGGGNRRLRDLLIPPTQPLRCVHSVFVGKEEGVIPSIHCTIKLPKGTIWKLQSHASSLAGGSHQLFLFICTHGEPIGSHFFSLLIIRTVGESNFFSSREVSLFLSQFQILDRQQTTATSKCLPPLQSVSLLPFGTLNEIGTMIKGTVSSDILLETLQAKTPFDNEEDEDACRVCYR
jgi:hypothetical protein